MPLNYFEFLISVMNLSLGFIGICVQMIAIIIEMQKRE